MLPVQASVSFGGHLRRGRRVVLLAPGILSPSKITVKGPRYARARVLIEQTHRCGTSCELYARYLMAHLGLHSPAEA
jgi:hypothetical protein